MKHLQYRVKKRNRCKEYGTSDGTRVRCTREKGHDGIHVTQLGNELILPWDKYSEEQLAKVNSK